MTDPEMMWERQEKRGDLAMHYWDLLDGRPGLRLADVGCGAGYFTARLAALTGPTGRVHATDVDVEALEYLRSRLDPVHHAHVTLEELDITRAPLPELGFDALLCTDALHHIDDVDAALRHLREADAPLLIADFDPAGPGEYGPPREHRIAPNELRARLRAAGWATRAWVALPHEHYAMVARPGVAP